jgi:hypothetical protein
MTVAVLFKIYIVVLLLSIGFSLLSGLFFLVKDDSGSNRLATSLTVRITLSVTLFVSLIVGYLFGWIQPHGPGF